MAPSLKQRKIAILGSRSVGKSSLTVQYCEGHFVESYYPTIENTFSHEIVHKGQTFLTEIIDTAGQGADTLPIMIVGNKNDVDAKKQRKVTAEEGQELGKELNCGWIETSARNNTNVAKAFELMIAEIEKSQEPDKPAGGGKCTVM
ncbi:GTP-binding protein [Exophiala xenobiotica]|nr:GTP-binding protein [Exophiala xenobiotica]